MKPYCRILAGVVGVGVVAGSNFARQLALDDELTEPVGLIASNHIRLPINQVLTPAGIQVELPGLRPQVLALSPDGKLLATSGKTHDLILLDPARGAILQTVPLPGEQAWNASNAVSGHIIKPDKEEQASFTGL